MSRNVQIVLLCEDTQHEAFVRRFLKSIGTSTRRLRVEKNSGDRGSAEQFVRRRYPIEVKAWRSKREQVGQALVVMVDGDNRGGQVRIRELDEECTARGITPRGSDERIAVFVPTWNIETWFAYLSGESVDNNKSDYPRLQRERDCQQHVNVLTDMCRSNQLRTPAPSSLKAACEEFNSRLR